ncbi:MAG: zinc-binding dehydrogenase family protein [Burkholderiales bacterium]|jgi:D-arabinose 1-dehydrogenase-like Zn-dependent alcohol dehydrogenase|nr:zinc-binding dehydrogenase family protein [Burkholderiales bacterium]
MISYDVMEHGKPLQKAMRATPIPKGSEVLVRITRSGVCHSDLHIWDGYFDWGGGKRFYVKERGCVPPFTLGHEPFGVVEALGPRARGVKVGQKRIVYPWIGCGKCATCKAGQDNYCLKSRYLGVNVPGAYSTHVVVPDAKYLVDASGIDDSFAATLACSALTAYSAAAKLPVLGPKDRVAVIGCGGVGLSGVSVLKAKGVKNIVACDIDPAKLAIAAKLGAARTLDTRTPQAAEELRGIAGALDFVGSPATAALGIGALRKGGRHVVVGLYGGELVHPLPPIAQRAIGIVGSYVGNLQELKEVVALAKRKKLKPQPIETRDAESANTSLEDLKAGRVVGRIVLDFEGLTA